MKKIYIIGLFSFVLTSCVDYLDKAPESSISDKEVFGNFNSFQGWVEEMYACMANYHQRCGNQYHTFNTTEMLQHIPMLWDDGNYWRQLWLYGDGSVNTSPASGVMSKYVWPLAWYAIRKANIGLQNIDLMQGTQEEKDLIKGQCLYFRAFYHFELIQFWGGLPYIDKPLLVNEVIAIPRLSYIETAKRAAEDFQAAADLLPLRWSLTNTLVANNDIARITKIHALAYKGKNLLYAASPMMNETSTGRNEYDTELCKQAAEAFAEVIRLCEQSDSKFALEPWENRDNVFALITTGRRIRSGGKEVIQNQQIYEPAFVIYAHMRSMAPPQFGAGNEYFETPCHNYTKNYGMANGYPIDDPQNRGNYDPDEPWKNREPRFYKDFIIEGDRLIENATTPEASALQYAHLHNNGNLRDGSLAAGGIHGSVSGYMYKKFLPYKCNQWDGSMWDFNAYQPRLRLADVYLMYAEAAFFAYGSAKGNHPGCDYTAQSAIERIRNRAQLPPLPNEYYANDKFMETLIRERAVELAFEGFRWFDLRRWNLAGELKYREKTVLDFDIDANGKPYNFRERLWTTRTFEKKHNWMPFQPQFTKIYKGFDQNPGW
jgi:hypothetical protein